jgi:hypothetical protein
VVTLAGELPLVRGETVDERRRRIEANLAPWVDPQFELQAPWIGDGNNRAFALAAVQHIERLFPLSWLDAGDPDVQLSTSKHRARVAGTARVSASQVGDLHGFDVAFDVDLRRDGKSWRVVRVELAEPHQTLPEARP